MQLLEVDLGFYSRYGAPVVEEVLKSIYLVYLIKSKRIGFMVDSAIFGFAIGAGFAFVENIYYLQSVSDPIYCFGLFEVLELPSCTAEQLRYWESFQEL